jgi:alpha-L-fucosidase 2
MPVLLCRHPLPWRQQSDDIIRRSDDVGTSCCWLLVMARLFAAALLATLLASSVPARADAVVFDVDWPSFLARSDPIWQWSVESAQTRGADALALASVVQLTHVVAAPAAWNEGPFSGNGELGIIAYVDPASLSTIRIDVGSTAIWDDRSPGTNISLNNFVFDRPRLPLGFLTVDLGAPIIAGSMRLALATGIISANVSTTAAASVALTIFCHARYDLLDVAVVAVSPANAASVKWNPLPAVSTWTDPHYQPNPPPAITNLPSLNSTLCVQPHLSGSSHAVGLATTVLSDSAVHFVAASHVVLTQSLAATQVLAKLESAVSGGSFATIVASHSAWWSDFWSGGSNQDQPWSFITMDASRLESFYYIQWYKMACATRPDRQPFDLMGPWFVEGTPWPDLHVDLNVQVVYTMVFGGNRPDYLLPYMNLLDSNLQNLINNVPEDVRADSAAAPSGASALDLAMSCYWDYGPDCLTASPTIVGNLLWMLQLYHTHWEYTGNSSTLVRLWPLLSRAVNYYLHLQLPVNGSLHLPVTFSPEYPLRGSDTSYDLALYRWGLRTALSVAAALNISESDDPHLAQYRQALSALILPTVDEHGYRIAADVPFNMSHRHFSHLFPVWPLTDLLHAGVHSLSGAVPADVTLAETSVDWWMSLPSELTGFCRPALSIMNVRLGRPASAVGNVTYLLNDWVLPNTMYQEGTNSPCGETPPFAAGAIQEWMVFTDESTGELFVFAGVDDQLLGSVAFHRLRARGGLLLSAARSAQVTQFVSVERVAGGDGILRINVSTSLIGPLVWSPSSVDVVDLGNGWAQVGLLAGDSVLLESTKAPAAKPIVSAAQGCPALFNTWGLPPATIPHSLLVAKCESDDASQSWSAAGSPGAPGPVEARMGLCLAVDGCDVSAATSVLAGVCGAVGQPSPCNADYCNGTSRSWSLVQTETGATLVQHVSGLCLGREDVGSGVALYACSDSRSSLEWTHDASTGQLRVPGVSRSCLTVGAALSGEGQRRAARTADLSQRAWKRTVRP